MGSLRLDTSRVESHSNGRELGLTPKEFGVLHYLMTRPGARRLRRGAAGARLDEHTEPVHQHRAGDGGQPAAQLGTDAVIETVVSKGYRLREDT
ncbi:hypothetical protein GCM10017559_71950 [Streptosporangium longisporum]|uniref:OmpR/PhoB-type domain-containing protein n=1 Tax=Streptosporangium longisporum TaxID=46187 RepID=A0ABP6LAV6_9ACTN